jgi:uncharacterized protein YwgA
MLDEKVEVDKELKEWLLLLFSAGDGASIHGKTMLMKMVFVLVNEVKPLLESKSDFISGRYGPYSNKIAKVVNSLNKHSFIHTEKKGRDTKFKITKLGMKELSMMSITATEEQIVKIKIMKQTLEQWGLNKVLNYVYTRYPKFTYNSKIRGTIVG